MIVYTELKTKFDLWDVLNFVRVSSSASSITSSLYYNNQGFILGFNISAPANFSGILYSNQYQTYLTNPAGETSALDLGPSLNVYFVVPLTQNQFFTTLYQNGLIFQALYEITSWGGNSSLANVGIEKTIVEY
jgi:hypothetical protein